MAVGNHLALPPLPKVADRPALEYHDEDVCDAESSDEYQAAPYDVSVRRIRHDAQVEGEDGGLAEGFGPHVEWVGEPEPLS